MHTKLDTRFGLFRPSRSFFSGSLIQRKVTQTETHMGLYQPRFVICSIVAITILLVIALLEVFDTVECLTLESVRYIITVVIVTQQCQLKWCSDCILQCI